MKRAIVFLLGIFTYLSVNAATINGVVTDRKTHEPLREASLVLVQFEPPFDTITAKTTAGDGSFKFSGLCREVPYCIKISLYGYTPDTDNCYKITGNDTITLKIGLTRDDRKTQIEITANEFEDYNKTIQLRDDSISLNISLEADPTGIVEEADDTPYKVYISEGENRLHIDNIRNNARLTIHTLSGRVLENCVLSFGSHIVSLKSVASRTVLFVNLQDGVNRISRKFAVGRRQ